MEIVISASAKPTYLSNFLPQYCISPNTMPIQPMPSDSKMPLPTGYKSADTSTPTPEEKEWAKEHWGSEHDFLEAYGLDIFKEEDRAVGRAIVRTLMKQESHSSS
ncbi:hypothetical protein B0T14DRAFT_571498 [Immersiella caudata]|uniref:Uncharacterized protein n=1 Tax=Immersiella caudata TaxID=314043 RepID=A0AA39WB66_9PEZI|nr:hypothetical protein B0T14DRAFT_571498 [Immersiella caudata]